MIFHILEMKNEKATIRTDNKQPFWAIDCGDEYFIELSNSIKAKYGKYCDNFIIKSNAIGSTNTSKYISFNVATVNDDKYIAIINKKNLKRHTLVLYCDNAIMPHVIGKGGKNLEYIKLNLVHNHGTNDDIHVLIKSYPPEKR